MALEIQDENLSQVTSTLSEVNPDVIAQRHQETLQEAPSPAAQPAAKAVSKDRLGRFFDPALHEVDPEGNPRINRDGYIACKPGRPGKTAKFRSEFPGQQKPTPQPAQQPNISADTQRKNTAILSTSLFIQIGVGFFGEEWLPQKLQGLDERENLVSLFDDFYRSTGLTDIPPGWALVLGLGAYGASRLHLPKTRGRFEVLIDSAKNFAAKMIFGFMGLFKKIKGVKFHAPHADSRNDGKRQDNPGPQTGEAVSESNSEHSSSSS